MKAGLFLAVLLLTPASACALVRDRAVAQTFPDAEVAWFISCVDDNDGKSLAPCKLSRGKLNYRGKEDWTPLLWLLAKEKISPQTMVALIKMGADPHSPPSPTAAGYAIEAMPIKYLKALVESGLDINDVTDYSKGESRGWGDAFIFSAIWSGEFEKVKYLVNHGADLEIRDSFGQTPILRANPGLYEMQILFLEKGANPRVVDKRGLGICEPIETLPLVESAAEYEEADREDVQRGIDKRTEFIAMLKARGIECVLGKRRVGRTSLE